MIWLLLVAMANAKLINLITLSRHGSRAPNYIVRTLCPLNQHTMDTMYDVPYEQLTKLGMDQLKSFGRHVRKVYVEENAFLSESLSTSHKSDEYHPSVLETYVHADAASRCGQSAVCMGYELYPNGTGFPQQPLSVVQQQLENEVLFCTTKNKCKQVMNLDLKQYALGRGKQLVVQHNKLLDKIGEICGVHPNTYHTLVEDELLGIKDVADAFLFEKEQNITSIRGMNDDIRSDLRKLQFQMLMERYYDTPRKITYWSSQFPVRILQHMKTAVLNHYHGVPSPIRYYSYHGHRELMYALSLMLEWPFQFENQPKALGQTAIPPGTSMFFEIHVPEVDNTPSIERNVDDFLSLAYLQFYMWSPDTKRVPIQLGFCNAHCTVSAFTAHIEQFIHQTGTWQSMCEHNPSDTITDMDTQPWWITISLCLNFVLGVGVVCISMYFRPSPKYQSIT